MGLIKAGTPVFTVMQLCNFNGNIFNVLRERNVSTNNVLLYLLLRREDYKLKVKF